MRTLLERGLARRCGSGGRPADGGQRLASAAAIKGFDVQGADGRIGRVDNVFIDDARWIARALVVATRGWLTGKLVQIPLRAVTAVDWEAPA